jgi:hypothetical protein
LAGFVKTNAAHRHSVSSTERAETGPEPHDSIHASLTSKPALLEVVMKHLSLTAEEGKFLYELLECCLSDLRVQISCADRWDYKKMLRERKTVLIQLMQKLEEAQSELETA